MPMSPGDHVISAGGGMDVASTSLRLSCLSMEINITSDHRREKNEYLSVVRKSKYSRAT